MIRRGEGTSRAFSPFFGGLRAICKTDDTRSRGLRQWEMSEFCWMSGRRAKACSETLLHSSGVSGVLQDSLTAAL